MEKTATALVLVALSLGGYAGGMALFGKNIGVKERNRKVFFTQKFHDDRKYGCVLVGDSRVYRGLNPDLFSETLKVQAANLGFDSAGFGPDLFQYIDDQLDTSGKIPIIVLGISPHSFTARAALNDQLAESRRLPSSQVDAILKPSPVEKYFRPFSLFQLPSIKDLLTKTEGLAEDHLTETYFTNGFAPAELPKNDPSGAVKSYVSVFRDQTFSEPVAKLLIQKVSAYSARGIGVFAVRLPVSKEIKAVEDQYSGFVEEKLVQQLTAAGGHWIKLPEDTFETFDGSHLSAPSANAASRIIALKVKQALKEFSIREPGSEHQDAPSARAKSDR